MWVLGLDALGGKAKHPTRVMHVFSLLQVCPGLAGAQRGREEQAGVEMSAPVPAFVPCPGARSVSAAFVRIDYLEMEPASGVPAVPVPWGCPALCSRSGMEEIPMQILSPGPGSACGVLYDPAWGTGPGRAGVQHAWEGAGAKQRCWQQLDSAAHPWPLSKVPVWCGRTGARAFTPSASREWHGAPPDSPGLQRPASAQGHGGAGLARTAVAATAGPRSLWGIGGCGTITACPWC